MAETMIVYCGLDCAGCAAYQATLAEDTAHLTTLAEEWYGEANADLTRCVGCTASNGEPLCAWCRECPVRACARMMAIPTCAHCIDYDTCPTLKKLFKATPDARPRLEAIRAAL